MCGLSKSFTYFIGALVRAQLCSGSRSCNVAVTADNYLKETCLNPLAPVNRIIMSRSTLVDKDFLLWFYIHWSWQIAF